MSRNKRVVFKLYSADCLSLTARALTFRFVTRKIFNLVVFVTRKIFNYLHLKALLICHGLENNETRMRLVCWRKWRRQLCMVVRLAILIILLLNFIWIAGLRYFPCFEPCICVFCSSFHISVWWKGPKEIFL